MDRSLFKTLGRLALLAAVALAGCSQDADNEASVDSSLGLGLMSSGLTGAADPGISDLAHAYVTIDKVTAHASGGWITVKKDIDVKVDILALKASVVDLGLASLPTGHITQVRLYVDGTKAPYVVTKTGAMFPLKVPSGEQSGIKIMGDWGVGGCDTMALTFDLDGKRSIWIHPNGNGLYILRPVIRLFQAHARLARCEAHGCQAPAPVSMTSAAAMAPMPSTQGHKTTICHVPPGNPANAHEITVGNPAVPAHLAHGDYLGACLVNRDMCGGPGGGNMPGGPDGGMPGGPGNSGGNPNNPNNGGTPPGWENPNNPHHTDMNPPTAMPPGGSGGSPPPVPCTTDSDCPANTMCTSVLMGELFTTMMVCTSPPTGLPPIGCTQTPDCPSNLSCSAAGICAMSPPGGPGGSQPPIPCATDTACPSNLACESGICGGPGGGGGGGAIPPIACHQTADCPLNLSCSGGICAGIPPGGSGGSQPPIPCTIAQECPTNLMCTGEICISPPDMTGTPVPSDPSSMPPVNGSTPEGGPCTRQADCALGSFCSTMGGICMTL